MNTVTINTVGGKMSFLGVKSITTIQKTVGKKDKKEQKRFLVIETLNDMYKCEWDKLLGIEVNSGGQHE